MIITLALTLACTLLSVTDGDTIKANCGGQTVRIRIADIDAPERDTCPRQWAAARDAMTRLATGPLAVTPRYQDRYDRTVADVTAQARDLGRAMVATGTARPWPHNARGKAMTPRPRGC